MAETTPLFTLGHSFSKTNLKSSMVSKMTQIQMLYNLRHTYKTMFKNVHVTVTYCTHFRLFYVALVTCYSLRLHLRLSGQMSTSLPTDRRSVVSFKFQPMVEYPSQDVPAELAIVWLRLLTINPKVEMHSFVTDKRL